MWASLAVDIHSWRQGRIWRRCIFLHMDFQGWTGVIADCFLTTSCIQKPEQKLSSSSVRQLLAQWMPSISLEHGWLVRSKKNLSSALLPPFNFLSLVLNTTGFTSNFSELCMLLTNVILRGRASGESALQALITINKRIKPMRMTLPWRLEIPTLKCWHMRRHRV